jgi:hypothetical protein
MNKDSSSSNAWEYVDFELEIGEGSSRKYPVTARSPAGEAQGEMSFPYNEWELDNPLLTLENALLRSGATRWPWPSGWGWAKRSARGSG